MLLTTFTKKIAMSKSVKEGSEIVVILIATCNSNLGSISSTFYKQLLRTLIPNA